jgi:hypothetical protein
MQRMEEYGYDLYSVQVLNYSLQKGCQVWSMPWDKVLPRSQQHMTIVMRTMEVMISTDTSCSPSRMVVGAREHSLVVRRTIFCLDMDDNLSRQ